MNPGLVAAMFAGVLVLWVISGSRVFNPYEKDYLIKDGRTVHCLVVATFYAKGISCDWAQAKR